MLCDLHIHSVFSDGSDTPAQICAAAKSANVQVISITDHDRINGEAEKAAAAKAFGLKYISGIELSSYDEDRQVHILGYGLDTDSKLFLKQLEKLEKNRRQRSKLMLSKLKAHFDIVLEEEDFPKFSKFKGSAQIGRALIKRGFVKNLKEAFGKYLGYGQKAYCPELRQSPKEAVETVHSAGGRAVLAHPGLIVGDLENTIAELANCGLFGIEAVYSSHTLSQTEYFKNLAKTYGLEVTGGSDYHGLGRSEKIGRPRVVLSQRLLREFKVK